LSTNVVYGWNGLWLATEVPRAGNFRMGYT